MDDKKLGLVESKFADIIWAHAPLHSRELVKLCEENLNWKKPTTYTVLRRLCERGIFRNQGSIVSACISREEFLWTIRSWGWWNRNLPISSGPMHRSIPGSW